jgi:hypothetical protein
MQSAAKPRLEVHEHCIISGPLRGLIGRNKFSHSHAGGDAYHLHPDTGPGSYTIDKDEWLYSTGLKGGGRKKFTVRPSGEQFPLVEPKDGEDSFQIIVGKPMPVFQGEGPGVALPMRMVLASKMTIASVRKA